MCYFNEYLHLTMNRPGSMVEQLSVVDGQLRWVDWPQQVGEASAEYGYEYRDSGGAKH